MGLSVGYESVKNGMMKDWSHAGAWRVFIGMFCSKPSKISWTEDECVSAVILHLFCPVTFSVAKTRRRENKLGGTTEEERVEARCRRSCKTNRVVQHPLCTVTRRVAWRTAMRLSFPIRIWPPPSTTNPTTLRNTYHVASKYDIVCQ